MDLSSTTILCDHLRTAKRPEDVFGALDGTDKHAALKHRFNEFVKIVHPDQNPDVKDAGVHLARLVSLRKEAEALLAKGAYGLPRKAAIDAVLRSRAGIYKVTEEFHSGELADLFRATSDGGSPCLLKVVRQPRDNDLLDFEARTLGELHRQTGEKARVFQKYLPKLIDTFALVENRVNRKVNVIDEAAGYYSFAEIKETYPDGLDTRDAAWMIRRAFEGLGWVHSLGYVHGAVLPEHLLVHPVEHGARIVDWSYAVRTGQRITAISAARKNMYPGSVMRREPATPSVDVQMVAGCAWFLLSDKNGKSRSDVPDVIAKFLDECRVGRLVADGWDAYRWYNDALKQVYGKRKYRAFAMPPRA
jgi:hypothetical protein